MDEFISTLKRDESHANSLVNIIDGFKIEIDSAGTGSDDNESSSSSSRPPLGYYDRASGSPKQSFPNARRRQLGAPSHAHGSHSCDRLKVPRLLDRDHIGLNQSQPMWGGASQMADDRNVRMIDSGAKPLSNTHLSKPTGECLLAGRQTKENTVMVLDMSEKSPRIQYRWESVTPVNLQDLAEPDLDKVLASSAGLEAHRSSGLDGHRSSGLDGHRSSGQEGHRSSGIDGHRSSGLEGHRSSGLEGHRSSGQEGHRSSGQEGHRSSGQEGHRSSGQEGHRSSGLDGHRACGDSTNNSIPACAGTVKDIHSRRQHVLNQVTCRCVNARDDLTSSTHQTAPLDLSLPKNKPAIRKDSGNITAGHDINVKHETSDAKSIQDSALDLRLKTPTSVSIEEKCRDKTQSPQIGGLLSSSYSQLPGRQFGGKLRPGEQTSGRNVIYKPIPRYPEFHTGYAHRHLQPFQAAPMTSNNEGILNKEDMFVGGNKYLHSSNRYNEMPWTYYGGDYDMVWNYSTTVTPALLQHPRPVAYLPSHLSHMTASLPGVPGLYSQRPPWCPDYSYLPSPQQRTFFTSDNSPQTRESLNTSDSCDKKRADQKYTPSSGEGCSGNCPVGVPHLTAGYGPWNDLCPGELATRSQCDVTYTSKLPQSAGFTPVAINSVQMEATRTISPGDVQTLPVATSRAHTGFIHGATSRINLEPPYKTSSGGYPGLPRGATAYGPPTNEVDTQYAPDAHAGRTCKDRSVQKKCLMQQPARDWSVRSGPSATEKSKTDCLLANPLTLSYPSDERGGVGSNNTVDEKTPATSDKQVKPRRRNKAKTPSKKCRCSDDGGEDRTDNIDGSQTAQSETASARKRGSATKKPKVVRDYGGGRSTAAAPPETLRLHRFNLVSSLPTTATIPGAGRGEDTSLLASLLANSVNPPTHHGADESNSERVKSAGESLNGTAHSKLYAPEEPVKLNLTSGDDAIKKELPECCPEGASCIPGRSPLELLGERIVQRLTEITGHKIAGPESDDCLKVTKGLTGDSDVTGHVKTEPNEESINLSDVSAHGNTVTRCADGQTADFSRPHPDRRADVGREKANTEGKSFVIDIHLKGGNVTSSVREILAGSSKSSGQQNPSLATGDVSQLKRPDDGIRCSVLPPFQQHQSGQSTPATARSEALLHATDCLAKSGKLSVCQCTPCSLCTGIFSSKFRVFSHFKRGCFTKSRYCVEFSDSQQDRESVTSVRKVESIDYRLKFLSDANMNSSRVSEEARSIWSQHTQALARKLANDDRAALSDSAQGGGAIEPAMTINPFLDLGRDLNKGRQFISVLSQQKKVAPLGTEAVTAEAELNASPSEEYTSANHSIKIEPLSPVTQIETVASDGCSVSQTSGGTSPRHVHSQGLEFSNATGKSEAVEEKRGQHVEQDTTKTTTSVPTNATSTTVQFKGTTTSVPTNATPTSVQFKGTTSVPTNATSTSVQFKGTTSVPTNATPTSVQFKGTTSVPTNATPTSVQFKGTTSVPTNATPTSVQFTGTTSVPTNATSTSVQFTGTTPVPTNATSTSVQFKGTTSVPTNATSTSVQFKGTTSVPTNATSTNVQFKGTTSVPTNATPTSVQFKGTTSVPTNATSTSVQFKGTTSVPTSSTATMEDIDLKLEVVEDDGDVDGETEKSSPKDATSTPVKFETATSPKTWKEVEYSPRTFRPSASNIPVTFPGPDAPAHRGLEGRYTLPKFENQASQTPWSLGHKARGVTPQVPIPGLKARHVAPRVTNPGNNSPVVTPHDSNPGNNAPVVTPHVTNPGKNREKNGPVVTPHDNNPGNNAPIVTPHVPKIYIVDKKGSRRVLADLRNPPGDLIKVKETPAPKTSLVNKRRYKRKRCPTKDETVDLTFSAATPAASQKSSERQFDVESPLATLRVNTGNTSQNLPLKTAIAFGESQRVNKNGEKERIMYLLDANNKPVMLVEKIGKNGAKVTFPNQENM